MLELPLDRSYFGTQKKLLARFGDFEAHVLRPPGGMETLLISNSIAQVTVLPFWGQQIWDMSAFHRRAKMRCPIDYPTSPHYFESYGAWIHHCGFACNDDDQSAPRNELATLRYERATLSAGTDTVGDYLAVVSETSHTRAFHFHYHVMPEVRLYSHSGVIRVSFRAVNGGAAPLPFHYQCQINFRPIPEGHLIDNASHHQTTRRACTPRIPEGKGAFSLLSMEGGSTLHALQVHPAGDSDIVTFSTDHFDHIARWIGDTGDYRLISLASPAITGNTSHPSPSLGVGEAIECELFTGCLSLPATERYRTHIASASPHQTLPLNVVALDAQSH